MQNHLLSTTHPPISDRFLKFWENSLPGSGESSQKENHKMVMNMNSSRSSRSRRMVLLLLAFGLVLMNPTVAAQKIIDITHTYRNLMPVWGSVTGGAKILQPIDPKNHFMSHNFSTQIHTGTHVDFPQHVLDLIATNPVNATTLSLQILIGPVLVIALPNEVNLINADVLRNLNLSNGLERVIFRTQNTERGLMNQSAFVNDYAGFTPDGAAYLVHNTTIKFVGLDYMSVAASDFTYEVHEILLDRTGIIPVECLNLENAVPGQYEVFCLPLKLDAEAAPVRCILMQ